MTRFIRALTLVSISIAVSDACSGNISVPKPIPEPSRPLALVCSMKRALEGRVGSQT
jgi:hypothetical protein